MQKIDLEVIPRNKGSETKQNPNQLRRSGFIPGVLYGHGEPVQIVVDAKSFSKAIHTEAGTNALFTVKLGTKKDLSIIKEVQRDILSRKPIHIDFQRINVKEKLELTVPVHTTGEAPGVKVAHGILQHIQREIRIKCLPDDIPTAINVDIGALELHHSIKVQDCTPPQGVEFITPGGQILMTVVSPKIEEEAPKPGAEAIAGAPALPEVIAKGKKDEEGVAAAPAGAPAAAGEGDKKKAK